MRRAICYLISIIAVSLFFISCKTIYVPVETVRTEYINKVDTFIHRDSIHYIDSVIVEKKGDTITLQKTKIIYRDRWQFQNTVDTIIKVDSIQVPYPVERQLNKWEKTKMDVGGIAMVALVVGIIIILLRWFIKTKFRK